MDKISVFKKLLYIRKVEEKIVELYPEQEMRCPVHLSIGQELSAVAVCDFLSKNDSVFSNHRSHHHYLAKGGNLRKFFAEIYGKETGCSKGRGGSMHLIDLDVNFMGATPIVGNIIPIALGDAYHSWLNDFDKISAVFFGDAASEEGVFHESLNFAKLKNLRVLFVCENNLYSVYTPIKERQPMRKISAIAKAHGLPVFEIDGYDVDDIYEKMEKAMKALKRGPVFLEIKTYRWREHCGPNYDNDIGYRSEKEFLEWKKRDPVQKLRKELLENNALSEEEMKKIEADIDEEIDDAVKFAKESEFPDTKELCEDTYAK